MRTLNRGPAGLRAGVSSAPRPVSALEGCAGPLQRRGVTPARRSVLVCVAAAGSDSMKPTVTIKMPYRVAFGETVRLVGSSSLLGDWQADRGLQLTWSEGDVWVAEMPIDAGHYEFKCVVYNESINVARWEDGGNRVLDISSEPGAWSVDCNWGATSDMAQAFVPAPAPATPVVEEVPVEEAPAQAAADEELLPTFMALSEEAEEAKRAEEKAAAQAAAEAAAAASAAAGAAAFSAGAAGAATQDDASSSGAGPIALLLATCAAGAAAAYVLLTPGAHTAALGSAGEAVNRTVQQSSVASAQVRSQLQSQMTVLSGQVASVRSQVVYMQPAIQAQLDTFSDTVATAAAAASDAAASLQPAMASGVALVQSTAEGMGETMGKTLDGLADLTVAAAEAATDLTAAAAEAASDLTVAATEAASDAAGKLEQLSSSAVRQG